MLMHLCCLHKLLSCIIYKTPFFTYFVKIGNLHNLSILVYINRSFPTNLYILQMTKSLTVLTEKVAHPSWVVVLMPEEFQLLLQIRSLLVQIFCCSKSCSKVVPHVRCKGLAVEDDCIHLYFVTKQYN